MARGRRRDGTLKKGYKLTKGGRVVRARPRSNPPLSLGNLGMRLTEGAMDALGVVGGKAAAQGIPQAVGLPQGGVAGIASQVGVGLLTAFVVDEFMGGGDAGRMILAGALAAPLENAVEGAGIPFVSNALSAYPNVGYRSLSSYTSGGRIPSQSSYSTGGSSEGFDAYPTGYEDAALASAY